MWLIQNNAFFRHARLTRTTHRLTQGLAKWVGVISPSGQFLLLKSDEQGPCLPTSHLTDDFLTPDFMKVMKRSVENRWTLQWDLPSSNMRWLHPPEGACGACPVLKHAFPGGLVIPVKTLLEFQTVMDLLIDSELGRLGLRLSNSPIQRLRAWPWSAKGLISLSAAKAASCSENQRHLRLPRNTALALPRPPCLITWRLALWGGFSGCNRLGVRAQLCPTLRPHGLCYPPASCARGVFPESILERAVISSCKGSSWPGGGTRVCCTSRTGQQILVYFLAGWLPLSRQWYTGCCACPGERHQPSLTLYSGFPRNQSGSWKPLGTLNIIIHSKDIFEDNK